VHPFCEIDQAGNQSLQLTSKQNYSGCPWQRNGCGGTSYRESTHIHPSSAPSHLVRERRGSDQFDVSAFISTTAQGHNCQNMQVVCKSLSSLPVAKTCASFETDVTETSTFTARLWRKMKTTLATEPHEFLLVSGGPLFQLYRRTHLAGDSLEWVRRRILVITLFVWLPLLLLSRFDGHALGGGLRRIRVACESVLFGFEDKWMEGALETSEFLGAADFPVIG
jgi:hypothetical protein